MSQTRAYLPSLLTLLVRGRAALSAVRRLRTKCIWFSRWRSGSGWLQVTSGRFEQIGNLRVWARTDVSFCTWLDCTAHLEDLRTLLHTQQLVQIACTTCAGQGTPAPLIAPVSAPGATCYLTGDLCQFHTQMLTQYACQLFVNDSCKSAGQCRRMFSGNYAANIIWKWVHRAEWNRYAPCLAHWTSRNTHKVWHHII